MATKHARTEARPSNFDVGKFVSVVATKRFEEFVVKQSGIPERGFELVLENFLYFDEIIAARKLEQFCKPPGAEVLLVVREFYANAHKHTEFKTRVRGKEIAFDKMIINKY